MLSIFIKFLFRVYLFYDFVKLHSDNSPFFVYTFKEGTFIVASFMKLVEEKCVDLMRFTGVIV